MEEWKKMIGKKKSELDTPCLVIDEAKLEHNIKKMQEHVERYGKKLRPHTKTHKSATLAKKQIEAGAIGVCVTKVSEAEALHKKGVRGILITAPIVTPSKIQRLMTILASDASLMIVTDSKDNIDHLQSAAKEKDLKLNVLIDIDSGQGRAGTSKENAIELARYVVSQSHLVFKGLQCYAGHVQHIQNYEERKKTSMDILQRGVFVINELKKEGIECEVYTGGGSGTHDIDVLVPEITDIQPGSYVVMDMEYTLIESKEDKEFSPEFRDAPMNLLATVIHDQKPASVTVDAGLKAIYKDGPGPKVVHPKLECQYAWSGDEHGVLHFKDPSQKPKVGTQVALVVSHCDPTINLFDKFWIIRDDVVVDVWSIDARGCVE